MTSVMTSVLPLRQRSTTLTCCYTLLIARVLETPATSYVYKYCRFFCPSADNSGYPMWVPQAVLEEKCESITRSELVGAPLPPDFKVLMYGNSHLRQVILYGIYRTSVDFGNSISGNCSLKHRSLTEFLRLHMK